MKSKQGGASREEQGYFRCLHSGKCCTTPYTPVNVSLGDAIRIREGSGIAIPELFQKHICLRPFGDPSDPLVYTLDFGLGLPCNFRKDKRCSIHRFRPINCRLFPYWLVVQAYKTGDEAFLDRTYGCMAGIAPGSVSEETIEAYIAYI
ncbi:hypothetical protein COY95_01880, partial [Candidatus Woesearchaeota archaeon CG_4_10_14_0_8_um_filter_47_5]